nr:hypothetical protein CFP56_68703 [Quercus suber]
MSEWNVDLRRSADDGVYLKQIRMRLLIAPVGEEKQEGEESGRAQGGTRGRKRVDGARDGNERKGKGRKGQWWTLDTAPEGVMMLA